MSRRCPTLPSTTLPATMRYSTVPFKSVHDGITYWVTGGAGAPSDAAPEAGGFQHYLLFTIDGPNVSAVVLQPWRLFAQVSPVAADGSCSVQAANYNYNDLPVCAELPTS